MAEFEYEVKVFAGPEGRAGVEAFRDAFVSGEIREDGEGGDLPRGTLCSLNVVVEAEDMYAAPAAILEIAEAHDVTVLMTMSSRSI